MKCLRIEDFIFLRDTDSVFLLYSLNVCNMYHIKIMAFDKIIFFITCTTFCDTFSHHTPNLIKLRLFLEIKYKVRLAPHYMFILHILCQETVLSTLLDIKSDATSKGFALQSDP
jgi:hypothetical protein